MPCTCYSSELQAEYWTLCHGEFRRGPSIGFEPLLLAVQAPSISSMLVSTTLTNNQLQCILILPPYITPRVLSRKLRNVCTYRPVIRNKKMKTWISKEFNVNIFQVKDSITYSPWQETRSLRSHFLRNLRVLRVDPLREVGSSEDFKRYFRSVNIKTKFVSLEHRCPIWWRYADIDGSQFSLHRNGQILYNFRNVDVIPTLPPPSSTPKQGLKSSSIRRLCFWLHRRHNPSPLGCGPTEGSIMFVRLPRDLEPLPNDVMTRYQLVSLAQESVILHAHFQISCTPEDE